MISELFRHGDAALVEVPAGWKIPSDFPFLPETSRVRHRQVTTEVVVGDGRVELRLVQVLVFTRVVLLHGHVSQDATQHTACKGFPPGNPVGHQSSRHNPGV